MSDLKNEILQILFEVSEHSTFTELADDETIQFDSLDRLLLAIELEEHFQIEIPDDEVDSWKCLNDIVATVQKYPKYHEANKVN